MDLPKIHWLTAIFLHLPVRAEALKAALGTAGHRFFIEGLRPSPAFNGGTGQLPDKPQFEAN